jgi:hypothetical protein
MQSLKKYLNVLNYIILSTTWIEIWKLLQGQIYKSKLATHLKSLRHTHRRSDFKFSTFPRRMGNIFEKSKNSAGNVINSIKFKKLANLKHNQMLKSITKSTFFAIFQMIISRLTGLFESMCEVCKDYGLLFHFYGFCVKKIKVSAQKLGESNTKYAIYLLCQ